MIKLEKNKKPNTYNHDIYEGHNNEKIISLNNNLSDCKAECHRIEKEIEDIRQNCDHEYKFYCDGPYEDNYICGKCGDETYK